MRSRWKAAVALVLMSAFSTTAYAGNYALNVTPSAAQTSRYDRGIASITSMQGNTFVRVATLAGNDRRSVSFVIEVMNAGAPSFNFGPENVVIRPVGMQPVALTTYEEAMEAERRRQRRERFWAGVAALGRGLSAADAGTTYTDGIYGGTTSGFVNGKLVTVNTTGTYSGTQHNPVAAVAAQRQAQEMNARDRENLEARWAARSSSHDALLRTTTVDPGAIYGGVATFPVTTQIRRARGAVPITIEVSVAGETHIFLGRLSEAN
jgi:hypothetical protein